MSLSFYEHLTRRVYLSVIFGLDPRIFSPKIVKKDSRVKHENDHDTTYSKKYFFCHCERSAAVHFLDCHVALLLAMTKQKKLVATFIDIPNLQFCSAKLEMSDNKRSLLNYTFTDINSKFRAIQ